MPELPEVETIRIQLSSVLVGKTIKSVEVRKAKLFRGDQAKVLGKKIVGLRRYSKLLVLDLTGDVSLAIHLKMTGRLVYSSQFIVHSKKIKPEMDYEKDKHTHIVIHFTDGSKLYFHDLRQFGFMQVLSTNLVENLSYVKSLGPEFLYNLTREQFKNILGRSNRPVKLVLMDQTKFAGVGNIYANEGLWCAKINPKAKANTLSQSQIISLFNCLEKILKQAIKWKGASDNSYRDAFGDKGEVQEHFKVYAREGQPCPRCRQPVRKMMLGARGTYWCSKCQNS